MLNRHTPVAGLYPTDLDLLKRVFDVLCAESGCQPGSDARHWYRRHNAVGFCPSPCQG